MIKEVRYFTQTGNTKMLALQIAKAAECEAELVTVPLKGKIDLLFLGASVYRAGVANQVLDFINTLEPKQVGKVVIFSTSAIFKRGYKTMSRALKLRGINVCEENFYCKGQFLGFHVGKPDEKDLAAAYDFAKDMCRKPVSWK
jgi:flavodoxin